MLFHGSDASVGLMLGSFFALIITIVFVCSKKGTCLSVMSWLMHTGRLQGNGTGNPDSYICMDTESNDRQSGC